MGGETKTEAALQEFDEARDAFREKMEGVPEPALSYLKPGDDYTLGGLVYHVNGVLERYLEVLQGVMAGSDQIVLADPTSTLERANQRALEGVEPGELSDALESMDNLHRQMRTMAASVPGQDWERTCAVQEGTRAPYAASVTAVLGWVLGHYEEHTPQVDELLRDWKSRQG
jgi:hypothetical protein